ncbi:hypothetical protein HK100_004460 [Physocladia obscura]|uniref:Uncharacterized protein n=1 Tax=Physocladia obscura TaxID=109957 RepID=A0AAD5T9W1_9FUNG|nr:hypothetical protein HK100_004460 [Physocladia obscura]
MVYSLLALDLDGTLLNKAGVVTARTVAALQRVRAAGAAVALCSGRASYSMRGVEAQLGFAPFVVSFNGAVVHAPPRPSDNAKSSDNSADNSSDSPDNNAKTLLFRNEMTPAQVSQVLQAANAMRRAVNYYGPDSIYCVVTSDEQRALAHRYHLLTGATYEFIDDYSIIQTLPPKMLIFGHDPDIMIKYLRENTSGLALIKDDWFVECLPPDMNKGVGFTKLCQALNIPIEQTIAFGDGWNDMEFIAAAGTGIAMKNARQELKDIASRITEFTNDEEGLAIELENFLSKGLFGPKN